MNTIKNKLNNNLIIHLLESAMAQPLTKRCRKDICSIEYLGNQSPKEEMLLYTRSRKKVIEEEEQDQPFHLYITPNSKYSELQCKNRLNTEQQTLQHTGRQEEPSRQLEEDRDTVRLKAIIDKKNRTIDEVTQQLKNLSEQVRRLKNIIKKQQYRAIRDDRDKRGQDELFYLQKNNLQLFEELKKYKKQRDAFQKQLISNKQTIHQLSKTIKELQAQNKQLLKQNDSLLQKTQQYLKEGHKEIKYLNKIKQIFYQKTGMENYVPLESCTLRTNHKSKQSSRMLSADLKGKDKSVKPFQLDNSSMTLKKDYNNKTNRKSNSNASDIKYRQTARVSGSLDLQNYTHSERPTSKSNKLLYNQSTFRQL